MIDARRGRMVNRIKLVTTHMRREIRRLRSKASKYRTIDQEGRVVKYGKEYFPLMEQVRKLEDTLEGMQESIRIMRDVTIDDLMRK